MQGVSFLVRGDDEFLVGSFIQGTGDINVLPDELGAFGIGNVDFQSTAASGAFQVQMLIPGGVRDGMRTTAGTCRHVIGEIVRADLLVIFHI